MEDCCDEPRPFEVADLLGEKQHDEVIKEGMIILNGFISRYHTKPHTRVFIPSNPCIFSCRFYVRQTKLNQIHFWASFFFTTSRHIVLKTRFYI